MFSMTLDKLNSTPVHVEYQIIGLMKFFRCFIQGTLFNTSIAHIEAGCFKLVQVYPTFLKNPFDILHIYWLSIYITIARISLYSAKLVLHNVCFAI